MLSVLINLIHEVSGRASEEKGFIASVTLLHLTPNKTNGNEMHPSLFPQASESSSSRPARNQIATAGSAHTGGLSSFPLNL